MTEAKDIYQFRSYKAFLKSKVGPASERRGVKRAMAKALRCQPTYVSQVVNGRAHFSLEQGEVLADFFEMPKDEKQFFLLLILQERAGTKRLEEYFSSQIHRAVEERLILTKRLGAENSLSKEDQSIYYSSWQYAAVHMALTIPHLRTASAIAAKLGIAAVKVVEILDFLCSNGLAARNGANYTVGKSSIRLGKESHNILKHHTNWRARAVDSLDRETISDLHYSGVVTLSREDILRIKDKILDFISKTVSEIRASEEEEICCLNLDFFGLSAHQEKS
jgi:uncharacterized protein (TIGR02147 family)